MKSLSMKRLLIAISIAVTLLGGSTAIRWFMLPQEVRAQTNTFCAANLTCNVIAAWNFKIFENTQYVDSTLSRGGVDIGDEINKAYAALPSAGGAIWIFGKNDGTCYNFTTPIVLTVSGKFPLIQGAAPTTSSPLGGGACLNYTPTTATSAVTLDYNQASGGNQQPSHGWRDVTLWNNGCVTTAGCGSSANGVSIGVTNGGIGNATFENFKIAGFSIGFNVPSGASNVGWGFALQHCTFYYNATAFSNQVSLENLNFYNTKFLSNGTGINSKGEIYAYANSFDGNTTVAVNLPNAGISSPGSDFTCYGCHFENPTGSPNIPHYITGTGNWVLHGGVIEDDSTTVHTIDFMLQAQGAWFFATDVEFAVNSPGTTTITSVVTTGANVRGAVRFINWGGTVPVTFVGGPDAANVANTSFNWNTSNAPTPWTLEANLKSPIGVGDAQFSPAAAVGLHVRANGNTIDHFRSEDTANTHTMDFGSGVCGGTFFTFEDITNTVCALEYQFTTKKWTIPTTVTGGFVIGSGSAVTSTGAGGTMAAVIASGTSTLTANATLGSATCQAAITTAAANVATTDSIEWSFATAPATGDAISPVASYVTSGNVNFTRCNPTAAAQNVTAIVINWRVIR